MDEKKYKLAVVGATGLVGRMVLQVLAEKNLPILEYVFLASSILLFFLLAVIPQKNMLLLLLHMVVSW